MSMKYNKSLKANPVIIKSQKNSVNIQSPTHKLKLEKKGKRELI